jgi:hypothetical protein
VEIDVYKEWLGIPEGPRPPDHYALLRLVQFEDSPEKVRANYKKLNGHVRKYAAGQYSVRSQELLNELAKAMLCLTDSERKHDYDASLGRKFEEKSGERPSLDKLLVSRGAVTREQMRDAREFAERSGISLRDAVVQMKFCDIAVATQAYAEELGRPFVDLGDLLPEDSALDRVPAKLVKHNSVLPLFIDDDVLLVAAADELEQGVEEELRLRFNGIPVKVALASPNAISQAIARYYAPGVRNEVAASGKDKGKSSKSETKAAPKKVVRRNEPISDEERQQNKQYGIIAICWSLIALAVIDWFVITPSTFGDMMTLLLFGLGVPIIGAAIWHQFFRR